jgi:hypothetical protein
MELTAIEAYYDTVPRAAAVTEEVGPFTVFLARPGITWDFYARPRLGLDRPVAPGDVIDVLARLTELGKPLAIEWVDQVTPSLLPAVRAALPDALVEECPLLALPVDAPAAAAGDGRYVDLPADSPDLDLVTGIIVPASGVAMMPAPKTPASVVPSSPTASSPWSRPTTATRSSAAAAPLRGETPPS